MDDLDLAQAHIEREAELRLQAARGRPDLPPTGTCYNCGEPVGEGRRWCDGDCRDDFERRRGVGRC